MHLSILPPIESSFHVHHCSGFDVGLGAQWRARITCGPTYQALKLTPTRRYRNFTWVGGYPFLSELLRRNNAIACSSWSSWERGQRHGQLLTPHLYMHLLLLLGDHAPARWVPSRFARSGCQWKKLHEGSLVRVLALMEVSSKDVTCVVTLDQMPKDEVGGVWLNSTANELVVVCGPNCGVLKTFAVWVLQHLGSAKRWGWSAGLNPCFHRQLSRLFCVQYFRALTS